MYLHGLSSDLGSTVVCLLVGMIDKGLMSVFTVLADAWKQCQDADVLLESPVAMAGVHIAEALSESMEDDMKML